jgi:UDP-N-acetylmuramoyl-tripeptide--D-alanyl-D-alanine ligase
MLMPCRRPPDKETLPMWTPRLIAQALCDHGPTRDVLSSPESNQAHQKTSSQEPSAQEISTQETSSQENTAHDPLHSWQATGISIDTRSLRRGDLFLALDGARWRGIDFLDAAYQAGAAGALVPSTNPDQFGPMPRSIAPHPHLPCIAVPNVLQALQALAHAGRKRFRGKILALTGSVGKTTTKEGLVHALRTLGSTCATPGSYNNQLGTAISLAGLDPEARYGIFELGMNHSGELGQLVAQVRPHVSAVLNVSHQHAAFFPNLEAIAHAKAEIFQVALDGVGVCPSDDPLITPLLRQLGKEGAIESWVSFGQTSFGQTTLGQATWEAQEDQPPQDNSAAGIRQSGATTAGITANKSGPDENSVTLIHVQPQGDLLNLTFSTPDGPLQGLVPAAGPHWPRVILGILACARGLGADLAAVLRALRNFMPLIGRGALLDIAGILVMDQSYNAAPVSMRAALKAFSNLAAGDLTSHDLTAGNPTAENLAAGDLTSHDLTVETPTARDPTARDLAAKSPTPQSSADKDVPAMDSAIDSAIDATLSPHEAWQDRVKTGRVFVALGEMRELGQESQRFHKEIAQEIAAVGADRIWLCGNEWSVLDQLPPKTTRHQDVSEILPSLIAILEPGDKLLLKGARGTKMFSIVHALYKHWGFEQAAMDYPLAKYL